MGHLSVGPMLGPGMSPLLHVRQCVTPISSWEQVLIIKVVNEMLRLKKMKKQSSNVIPCCLIKL